MSKRTTSRDGPLLASAAAVALVALPLVSLHSAPQQEREIRGELAGWRFGVDGTVSVRVLHASGEAETGLDDESTSTWFRTPPDASDLSDIEARVLDIVLTLEATPERETLVVTGKLERARDGSSLDTAVPLVALSRP